MENKVVEAKNQLINNIEDLFLNLEKISIELDTKEKKLKSIKGDIDEKHQDINSFKKVSFIANLNKQLESKNTQIEILEKRIISLTRRNEKLRNELKEFKEVNDDDNKSIEDVTLTKEEEEDDIWKIREFDNQKFLFNSETRKFHEILKNEKPGNIIGRLTSKDKFKKYNQPKEYI